MPDPTGDLTSYGELADLLGHLPLLLREARRQRQLSVRAAAVQLGMSFSTVSRIEAGVDCVLSNAVAVLRWLGPWEPAEQPEPARPPVLGVCPSCSRPAIHIRDHDSDGLTVARQWLPCGCTRIVPVGGDRG